MNTCEVDVQLMSPDGKIMGETTMAIAFAPQDLDGIPVKQAGVVSDLRIIGSVPLDVSREVQPDYTVSINLGKPA